MRVPWQAWLLGAALACAAGGLAMRAGPPAPGAASPPVATYATGSAGERLAAYVHGDFAGERLERASWAQYQHWVMWRTEPAWDEAYVVRSYRLAKITASPTEASAEVRYDTLGVLDLQTFSYRTSPSEQAVPFKLLLSEGAWKLGLPMLRPHPSPDAAVAFLQRMSVHFTRARPVIAQAIATIRADAAKPVP